MTWLSYWTKCSEFRRGSTAIDSYIR